MALTPLKRWALEREMLQTDPVRAKLYKAEAITDRLCDCDVCDASNLRNALDLFRFAIDDHAQRHGAAATFEILNKVVRRAIVEITDAPYLSNPLYPGEPTDGK